MANETRRRRPWGLLIGFLWLLSLALLAAAILGFSDTRLARRSEYPGGFPYMPRYGAITWWFFLTIPVIGLTYAWLNEWRRRPRREPPSVPERDRR